MSIFEAFKIAWFGLTFLGIAVVAWDKLRRRPRPKQPTYRTYRHVDLPKNSIRTVYVPTEPEKQPIRNRGYSPSPDEA